MKHFKIAINKLRKSFEKKIKNINYETRYNNLKKEYDELNIKLDNDKNIAIINDKNRQLKRYKSIIDELRKERGCQNDTKTRKTYNGIPKKHRDNKKQDNNSTSIH